MEPRILIGGIHESRQNCKVNGKQVPDQSRTEGMALAENFADAKQQLLKFHKNGASAAAFAASTPASTQTESSTDSDFKASLTSGGAFHRPALAKPVEASSLGGVQQKRVNTQRTVFVTPRAVGPANAARLGVAQRDGSVFSAVSAASAGLIALGSGDSGAARVTMTGEAPVSMEPMVPTFQCHQGIPLTSEAAHLVAEQMEKDAANGRLADSYASNVTTFGSISGAKVVGAVGSEVFAIHNKKT